MGTKLKLIIAIMLIIGGIGAFVAFSYNGGHMSDKKVSLPSIDDVPSTAWTGLSQQKIYFGHQSVGFNMLDGIKDLKKTNQKIELNIVETTNPEDLNKPVFAHSTLGENRKPKTKIDAFADVLEKGIGNKVDIAFLKFCYVDVVGNSDIKEIFNYYKETLIRLQKNFPKITFVHMTVPLKTIGKGPKAMIKRLIGKSKREDNIKRNQFNQMMLKEYESKEPVFDLAQIESIAPDGQQQFFKAENETYLGLFSYYSDDGGHLNPRGQQHVAEQLLIFLSNLN